MTDIPGALVDLKLVQKALEDRASEELILRRLYPRIRQVVKFIAGSRSQVDDIVQLAAIEVVKSFKWYKGLGSLESWAVRITYRTAMKQLKRKSKFSYIPLFDNDTTSNDTPEKALSRKQLFESLLDKLDVIPEKRRVPLLLHLAFGYTIPEVAKMTDASPNTVKDRLKTAFREFRAILDEYPNLAITMLEEL